MPPVVDIEHDRQRDRRLGRRKDDHEHRDRLPVEIQSAETGEGYKINVGGVQDQLDSHQHHDRVAPGDDPDETQGEEDRAEQEVMVEAGMDSQFRTTLSLRAMSAAPIRATSNAMEATSNGSRMY